MEEYKKRNEDSGTLKNKLTIAEQKILDQDGVIKDMENRLSTLQKAENEFKSEV